VIVHDIGILFGTHQYLTQPVYIRQICEARVNLQSTQ